MNRSKSPDFLSSRPSPDPALISLSRPLSVPDRKLARQKGERGIAWSISRRMRGVPGSALQSVSPLRFAFADQICYPHVLSEGTEHSNGSEAWKAEAQA